MDETERVELALAALAEVTDPADVGELIGASAPVPGVVDLRFATTRPGYPGWAWTVSTSAVDGVEPTVLEIELLPGEAALLAPAWVPWAERLAEWRRVHPADAADEGVEDGDDESDLDDERDLDDEDAEVEEGDEDEDEDEDFDEDDDDDLDGDPEDVLDDGEIDGVDVEDADGSDPEDPDRA